MSTRNLDSPLPCAVAIPETGVIREATGHYQRRLSDLRGLFLDTEALEKRIREENDPVCYENYAFNQSQAEGDIFFGTTIIYPGKVGSEYHLTRGHYHSKRDHAETYQALSGHGLVLFEREDGTTCSAELTQARSPTFRHSGHIAPSTPATFLWCSSGPALSKLATIMQRSASVVCGKWSWNATESQASRTARAS
jgi:Glucose-6-phosphate isomerase (GPI)